MTDASPTRSPIPFLRRTPNGKAVQLIVEGNPFLMLAGELHNSSASSPAYMAPIWPRLKALNLNTVLAVVSWDQFEPQEGTFDYTLMAGLIADARTHGLKLVLLWFGSCKNSHSSYAPTWVKRDLNRFFRAELRPGVRDERLSSFCQAAGEADARAFAALMRCLRDNDPERTVLMVQVENETGILGASRDRCAAAERAFHTPVPADLIAHLQAAESLHPALAAQWARSGRRAAGTWSEVFGAGGGGEAGAAHDDPYVNEIFMAWHIGRYVGAVAAAGRAEYPLPLFANAWLVQHDEELPGQYPCGGPVSRMIDIWQAAAPAFDLFAPDIYIEDFAGVCAEYHRPNNPLFIPEARRDHSAAAHALYALAEHDALGFAPFGIDSVGIDVVEHMITGAAADASFVVKTDSDGRLLAQTYRLLSDMMPLIAAHQGTGMMRGILYRAAGTQQIDLGDYRLQVRFSHTPDATHPLAGGLVIALSPNELLIAGFGFSVHVLPRWDENARVDQLTHWEGDYRAGAWIPRRRLNGDEWALRLGDAPEVRRVELFTF